MSKSYTFTTTHLWHDSRGSECECEVIVEYDFTPGYDATWDEPGSSDTVEVIGVMPVDPCRDIGDIDLEAFADECMADARDRIETDDADAAEYLAEQRADDLMRERWA